MKKNLLIALLIGMVAVITVNSAPRLYVQVQKIYRNHGDTRSGFLVTVASTSWTTVMAADVERRYAQIHTTSTVIDTVCLSTISASATVCEATLPGRKFPGVGSQVEDYSEAILYARVIDGSGASIYLLGEQQYDSAD